MGQFKDIREDFETGRIDILSGWSLTEERARNYLFTVPHTIISWSLFVRKDGPRPRSEADLAGLTLLAQKGDLNFDYFTSRNYRVVGVPTPEDAFRELGAGRGDCAIVNKAVGLYILRRDGIKGIRRVEVNFQPLKYCIALHKGEEELLGRLNEALFVLNESGRFREIHERHFAQLEQAELSLGVVLRRTLVILVPLGGLFLVVVAWSWSLRIRVRNQTRALNQELANRTKIQEILRESEERYRLIFDQAPLGILHFDVHGVLSSCNQAFAQQLGSSYEALRGFDMLARISNEGVRKAIQDACEGKRGLFEGPYVSVTGRRTAYGRVHTCALHTPEGEFLGGMGIVEDLSDLKRLEEDRQRLTDLYAALSQANQAIVHATDEVELFREICRICIDWAHFDLAWIGRPAREGSRVDVVASAGPSEAYLEGVEVSVDPESPFGRGPSGCCLWENREQVCQDWELDPRMQPWSARATAFGIRSSAAFPLVCEGRVVASLNLYSTEVGFFRPDRQDLLREMALDLSFALEGFAREGRRNKAEQAFRATFEQAAVGFTHMAPEGRFLRVNQRFVEMTGYTEEELLALSFSDITHPDDGESDARNLRALLEGMSRSQSREKRYLCKDGHLLWVKLTTSLVRHPDGTPDYFVNVVEDITRQKFDEEVRHRMEASLHQAQKMESLGALAAGIAHDMNNLLAAIMGMAEVMQATCAPDGPFAKSITTILRAAGRGRDLVKGLTSFARRGLDEPTWLDLNEVVREELELLSRTTLRKVEVRSDLDPTLPPILGEPSALSSVLMNLCVNAVDAMPQGGSLSIQTGTLPDGWVELSVSDTGQGMPPDMLARAMEPFFTTKPVGKGTGLSVVFGVLQAHGGTVEIQSEPGEGTTIRLRFPIAAGSGQSVQDRPVVIDSRENPLKILLVDDEEFIRDTISSLLGSLGHQVAVAQDGQEALERLEGGPEPDLMVLDQCMPILTGSETLERLRKRWPRLPVILATGYLDAAVEAKVAGFARVWILRKPYALAEIRQVIQEILSE